MGEIFVEGLGKVQIQGDTPTAEESAAIVKGFQQRNNVAPIPEPIPDPSRDPAFSETVQRFGRTGTLLNAASGGFAGEAQKGAQSLGLVDESVPSIDDLIASTPKEQQTVGNLAGGALSGIALGGANTIRGAMALGAAEGAVAGAGFSEGGLEQRAIGAGTGAALGAGFGFLIPTGTRMLINGISRASQNLKPGVRFALDRVMRDLKRGGVTADEAVEKVKKLGGDAILADIPELRSTARATAAIPGPGAKTIAKRVGGRAAEARERITQTIRSVVSAEDFGAFQKTLIDTRQNQARQLYNFALRQGELAAVKGNQQTKLGSVMNAGPVKSAIRQIKNINPEFADLADTDMQILDRVYKRIGERARAQGAPANELKGLRVKLKEAIAEQVPAYREAVDTFSDQKSVEDALDLGRKVFREDDFVTALDVMRMNEVEKEAFLAGVSRAAADEVSKGTVRANVSARLFSAKNKPKLQAALGKGQFETFKTAMLRELEFAETNATALTGSRTTPLAEDVADLSSRAKRAGGRLAAGQKAAAAGELFRSGRSPAISPEQSQALGELLSLPVGERSELLSRATPTQRLLLEQLLGEIEQSGTRAASAAAVPAAISANEGGQAPIRRLKQP